MSIPTNRRVDLQSLPRFGDGWTFLYTEHVRIDKEDNGISLKDVNGIVAVPVAALSVLLVGPGATLTHGAMTTLADNGCSVVWVGEGAVRCYAANTGETNNAANLMHQASVWADPIKHMEVVRRMYRMRFPVELEPSLSLEQIRGKEGVRVRDAYARAAAEHGIEWSGRNYKQQEWNAADPVNRALSCANSCLYGLCHAAIVSTGFSPGLGFVHTGKMLSFVYDIADLYKVSLGVPVAFSEAKQGLSNLESRVRRACRDAFFQHGLISKVVPDIQIALGLQPEKARVLVHRKDEEGVVGIWDPTGALVGGQNFGDPPL